MNSRHADRLWALIGAVAVAGLLAVGWFALIGPRIAETEALEQQVVEGQTRVGSLQRRLADLRAQESRKAEYAAELNRHRAALPTGSGIPDFLRQLQAAGGTAGVSVSGVTVGGPTPVEGVQPAVYSLPITLSGAGTPVQLDGLLDQIQRVQPRAVLVKTVAATSTGADKSTSGVMDVTITLTAFVAPSTAGK